MRAAGPYETLCGVCGGRGYVLDPKAEGAEWRARRKRRGESLRSLAQAIGYTASYLCDLELGRRKWNAALRDAYREAL